MRKSSHNAAPFARSHFGAPRELQFVVAPNGKRDLAADLVLPAIDKTMNIMKPGAQQQMKHAVGRVSIRTILVVPTTSAYPFEE